MCYIVTELVTKIANLLQTGVCFAMRLISWNVNGLRACAGKGFEAFFHAVNADCFCLQETKLQPEQITLDLPGYRQFWNSAEKKGYSGTAQRPLRHRYSGA